MGLAGGHSRAYAHSGTVCILFLSIAQMSCVVRVTWHTPQQTCRTGESGSLLLVGKVEGHASNPLTSERNELAWPPKLWRRAARKIASRLPSVVVVFVGGGSAPPPTVVLVVEEDVVVGR